MITVASAAVALLLASPQGQTAPPTAPQAAPGSAITSDLNSGPPRPATYLAPQPEPLAAPVTATPPAATARPAPTPAPSPPVTSPATATPPRSDNDRVGVPAPAVVPAMPPSRPIPAPVAPSPGPRIAPVTPPRAATPPVTSETGATPAVATPRPTAAPAVVPPAAEAPPPPAAPVVTVLDAAARAALPFSVDLPPGFEMVTGRPGPDFRIYTIRRGERSVAMVYTGPASQFPIFSGQMVEAGGRASVVSTEDGVRHAMEHLFQRPDAPREIHVWTMSLDGADRALAEQIAQSVDVR